MRIKINFIYEFLTFDKKLKIYERSKYHPFDSKNGIDTRTLVFFSSFKYEILVPSLVSVKVFPL